VRAGFESPHQGDGFVDGGVEFSFGDGVAKPFVHVDSAGLEMAEPVL
jgi:hypothetical protein